VPFQEDALTEEKEFSTDNQDDGGDQTEGGAEHVDEQVGEDLEPNGDASHDSDEPQGGGEEQEDELFLDLEDSDGEVLADEDANGAAPLSTISADELNDALDAQARAEEKLARTEESLAKAEDVLGQVRKELDAARVERDDYKNRFMRNAADLDNFRRRAQREQEELRKYGIDKVVSDLIPAVDNLERALQHAATTEESGSIVDGVRMVYKQIVSALAKYGVEGFESKGQMFDPQRHEAIQQVESTELPSGTVMEQYQKGYFLHDRLLRPALVSVAKFVGIPQNEIVATEDEQGEEPAAAADGEAVEDSATREATDADSTVDPSAEPDAAGDSEQDDNPKND
jgi:molecular chaperone GrpE